MPFAILFNLAVFVMIAVMWILFVVNIIRVAKRNTTRTNTSRTTRTNQTMTRTERQHSMDRQRRNEQSPAGTSRSLQTLLRQNPTELYRTLKEQLPDAYKDELQDIFNAPNPAVELIKFLRRKDVWPFIQKLLRQEAQPVNQRRLRPTAEREPTPQADPVQHSELDEGIEEIASASSLFEREQEELMAEYDAYADYFDQLLSEVDLGDDSSSLQRIERIAAKKEKAVVDQNWLKNAMIAKEILEKPDF